MTDLSTAVIGLLILLTILFFFMYLNIKQRKKKQAAANYLQQLITQHNLQIDIIEEQRHMLLALDKQHNKLLYIKNPSESPQPILIDLKEVKTSRVADKAQIFYMDNEKKQKDTLTTDVAVELFYPKGEDAHIITFYNYIEHSSALLPELRSRANYWNKQLQEVIDNRKASVS